MGICGTKYLQYSNFSCPSGIGILAPNAFRICMVFRLWQNIWTMSFSEGRLDVQQWITNIWKKMSLPDPLKAVSAMKSDNFHTNEFCVQSRNQRQSAIFNDLWTHCELAMFAPISEVFSFIVRVVNTMLRK